MKLKFFCIVFFIGLFSFYAHAQNCIAPAVGCSNVDMSNVFLFSEDPNSLEYDHIVSAYHSSGARINDGTFKVWGERSDPLGGSFVVPTEINSNNFSGLTGTVLKYTQGSNLDRVEHIVLTTTGLFSWGNFNVVINQYVKYPNYPIIAPTNTTFTKIEVDGKPDGLPPGVAPADVKMLFGTFLSLVITTCDGSVWILTQNPHLFGDGSLTGEPPKRIWHRVKTNAAGNPFLKDVVATRGNFNTMMALTRHGEIYTWGYALIADGAEPDFEVFARPMNLPLGITPKMIGICSYLPTFTGFATMPSYYVLTTKGAVYGMGNNQLHQLGDFTDSNRFEWVRTKKSTNANDYLDDILWISPSEHDPVTPAVSALTREGKRYAWGFNSAGMLGVNTANYLIDPTNVILNAAAHKVITAIETGGHTTIILTQCDTGFGYAGHFINGSAANGSMLESVVDSFMFNTASVKLCSGNNLSSYIERTDEMSCVGNTITLKGGPANSKFYLLSGNATLVGNNLTITGPGEVKLKFYESNVKLCGSEPDYMSIYPRDYGNFPLNQIAYSTLHDNRKIWLGNAINKQPNADCATDINDSSNGVNLYLINTAPPGNGSVNAPFVLKPNNNYVLRINMSSNHTFNTEAYYAVFIDIDGNGSFKDNHDYFFNGRIAIQPQAFSLTNKNVPFNLPAGIAIPPKAYMRVVATSRNLNWDKMLDGKFDVINGEVEDYFLTYEGANGITTMNQDRAITVFPNPVQNQLNVNGLKNNDQLILYTIDGRKVIEESIHQNSYQVNVSALNMGIYLLEIKRENNIVFRNKVVKDQP